jgi:hypothetical protein
MFARSATANAVRALDKGKGLQLQVGSMGIDRNWLCPGDEAVACAVTTAKLTLKQRLQLLFS